MQKVKLDPIAYVLLVAVLGIQVFRQNEADRELLKAVLRQCGR